MTNGEKYKALAVIAVGSLLVVAATTIASMWHWPVEPQILRDTNTALLSLASTIAGVLAGASRPDARDDAPTEAPRASTLTALVDGGGQ